MYIYTGPVKDIKEFKISREYKYSLAYRIRKTVSYLMLGSMITLTGFNTVSQGKQYIVAHHQYQKDLEYINANPIDSIVGSEISIVTANVQNKYFKEDSNIQSGSDLVVTLVENDIDVIGIQEIKTKSISELEKRLEEMPYSMYGELRFGNGVLGKITDIIDANEAGSIISKEDTYMKETLGLPWLPQSASQLYQALIEKGSLMKRVVTCHVTLLDGVGYAYVYNIHADYGVEAIQLRQFQQFLDIIDQDQETMSLPTIVMGDFNATPDSDNMQYLISELSQRGIYVVPVSKPTYKGKYEDGLEIEQPKQVDYIFLSEEFVPKEVEIIPNKSSDHDAVYVKAIYYPKNKY